jgi:hypothetical protein
LLLISVLFNASPCWNIPVAIHILCANKRSADDNASSRRVPAVKGISYYTDLLCWVLVIVNHWRGTVAGRHFYAPHAARFTELRSDDVGKMARRESPCI